MILPKISGDVDISNDGFYFGCDSIYFELYGQALLKSLEIHAPWANKHVHLFNPTETQIQWCKNNKTTLSFEYISLDKEIKTYYACVRFIRIPEIFKENTRLISLDCDSISVKEIPKSEFLKDTDKSAVLWRKKSNTSLAGSVFFGPDNFRYLYANNLKQYFYNDSYEWFLDQNVLDIMVKNKEVDILEHRSWANSKIKRDTYIWSAKGNKKLSKEFVEELKKWNN